MAQSPRSKTTAKRAAPKPAPKRKSAAGAVDRTPLLEWLSAGVGLVLILATLGIVGSELFRADDTPPRFTIRTVSVEAIPGGFHMVVRVHNDGGSPAAGVVVEGELTPPSGPSETAEASFDFIADKSSREGGLYFETDPRQGEIRLRAKGYSEP